MRPKNTGPYDEAAIAVHSANHPTTKHYCQSIYSADPLEVTQHRPVLLGWFSPDCKHFSKAKGGKPVDKNIRGLANVVVHWAEPSKQQQQSRRWQQFSAQPMHGS